MIKYHLQVRIFITGGIGLFVNDYHHGSRDVWNLARVNGITSKINNGAKQLEKLLSL